MSGMIPSFLSGAKLVIQINGLTIAYGSNLSFSDRMATAPVAGIGSYNADAIEPLQYSASGSFAITVYSSSAFTAISKDTTMLPSRSVSHSDKTASGSTATTPYLRNGNSMLNSGSFSPVNLMISRTFDIDVYERVGTGDNSTDLILTYQLIDCRLTSYSMSFTPGSLVQESIGFMCIEVADTSAQETA